MVISSPTAARSVVSTICTALAGRPADSSAWETSFHKARFDWMASEPPRRMQALPLLIASEAASMVTLGRLSKIMPNTPSGTRIWPTLRPEGRRLMPVISPTGSGIAASWSQPSAMVAMILSVRRRRSTIGAARPAASAAATSRALASRNGAPAASSSRASSVRVSFFALVEARAIAAEAARACWPTLCM